MTITNFKYLSVLDLLRMEKENLVTRLAGQGKLDATIEKLADEFGIPMGSSSGGDYKSPLAKEQVAIALMSVPDVFRPGKPLPTRIDDMTRAQSKVLGEVGSYHPPMGLRELMPLIERAIFLYSGYEHKQP